MHARHVLATLLATGLFAATAFAADGLASIKGRVTGPDGPVPGARVFLESGLEGPLTVLEADAAGNFAFEGVVPALVGVFAYAPGLAVDGRGVQLALDQNVEAFDIRLSRPGTVAGAVTDDSGRPVAGARISRAVILGTSRVGIPFSKLEAYGIAEPTTDTQGAFAIHSLPDGAEIGLKVAHPSYAQGVVGSTRVGGRKVAVTLSPGILVSGTVLARGQDVPVGNASLEFRSVEPPNDTVITYSRADGGYVVRLRPGPWLYQASGHSFRTPSWQRIELDPKFPAQSMSLYVAGTSTVRGFVKDAKSGEPIANARILLSSLGAPAATALTGPTGAYEFTATEGENIVQLGLAPGFLLPPEPAFRVAVTAGKPTDLPTFWVVPLPKYSLEVVDSAEAPVSGAIVRVLDPPQFGWYETDPDGLVELSFATLPADGTVIGTVEHPTRREAAMFAIARARSADAIVQLQPLTRVTGRVTNEKEAGIEGAIVEAATLLEGMDRAVTLWRTVSGSGGKWTWPAAVPHVPVMYSASVLDSTGTLISESDPIALLPVDDTPRDVGSLIVNAAKSTNAALGRKYDWRKLPVVCGAVGSDFARRPAIVVHAPVNQYAVFADSLANVERMLRPHGILVAIVVDGEIACKDEAIVTLRGVAPSRGTIYLTNAQSEVVFEGFDLPPLAAILDLTAAAGS